MNAIFTRTSVRSYEERLVETEKIERILKAAMAAPSAMKNLSVFTIMPFGYPIQKNPQQSHYDETRVHYVK